MKLNFLREAEGQRDGVCERYVQRELSATVSNGNQLAFSLCSAQIAREADTRLSKTLVFRMTRTFEKSYVIKFCVKLNKSATVHP